MITRKINGSAADIALFNSSSLNQMYETSRDSLFPGTLIKLYEGMLCRWNFAALRDIMVKRGFRDPITIRWLRAHGSVFDGVMKYSRSQELDDLVNVQDWIHEHDGNYSALMIDVCNVQINPNGTLSKGVTLSQPDRSFLIYPSTSRPTLKLRSLSGYGLYNYEILPPIYVVKL